MDASIRVLVVSRNERAYKAKDGTDKAVADYYGIVGTAFRPERIASPVDIVLEVGKVYDLAVIVRRPRFENSGLDVWVREVIGEVSQAKAS